MFSIGKLCFFQVCQVNGQRVSRPHNDGQHSWQCRAAIASNMDGSSSGGDANNRTFMEDFVEEGTADKDLDCDGPVTHDGKDSSELIRNFCKELKTIVEQDVTSGTGVESVHVINSFDSVKLCEATSLSSVGRIPALCDFDEISKHVFKSGECWSSRDLLFSVASQIGRLQGWTCVKSSRELHCSRCGENKRNLKRKFRQGPLRVGCTWRIRVNPFFKERDGTNNKPCWDKPIRITKVCSTHGGGCTPGKTNLVATRNRGGHYQVQLPGDVLFSLCVAREQGKRLSYAQIKNAITPAWPKAKRFTKYEAYYLRLKVH